MSYNNEQYQGEEPKKNLHTKGSNTCICNPFIETIETFDVESNTLLTSLALVHQEIINNGDN